MTASSPGDGTRPDHLAHHFDTPRQQFEAAKLGMWLFLATEVLMFGGLFCAYTVVRALHPEVFLFGSQYLDTTWGAINTVVLILSSLTMALAVWCAQIGHRAGLIVFLGFTLLFAVDFLVIKYIEYSHKFHENLVWGVEFYDAPSLSPPKPAAAGDDESDATRTERADKIWMDTCRVCHALDGAGVAGQGKDLRGSSFISDQSDSALLAFLKKGRMAGDEANTMGIMMPPRGGNPMLSDRDLSYLIPRLREYASQPAVNPTNVVDSGAASSGQGGLPASLIPPPSNGPPGLVAWMRGTQTEEAASEAAMKRPANAHVFFGLYFCMTGLHGIHVLGGIIVISILLILSMKNRFGSSYFTPVELSGLYWHIVDIIWIFLFPLLYLIG